MNKIWLANSNLKFLSLLPKFNDGRSVVYLIGAIFCKNNIPSHCVLQTAGQVPGVVARSPRKVIGEGVSQVKQRPAQDDN